MPNLRYKQTAIKATYRTSRFSMTDSTRSRKRQQWALSAEAFSNLLLHLDPDPERAGEKYNELHKIVTAEFRYLGSARAEDLADLAINRIIRKIEEGVE